MDNLTRFNELRDFAQKNGYTSFGERFSSFAAKIYQDILLGACRSGNIKTVNSALESYYIDNKCLRRGLEYASRSGNTDIVKLLLEHGVEVNDTYALNVASENGHIDVVKLLLEHGVEVNGKTMLLYYASRSGRADIVKLLLEHGVEVNDTYALYYASENGRADIVKLLLEHGAEINNTDVLCKASRSGNTDIVKLLLEHGAEINNTYALYYASENGHIDIVKLLLDHGAEINNTGALCGASRSGNTDIVKLLLEHGAHISRVMNWAFGVKEDMDIVDFLVEYAGINNMLKTVMEERVGELSSSRIYDFQRIIWGLLEYDTDPQHEYALEVARELRRKNRKHSRELVRYIKDYRRKTSVYFPPKKP